MAEWFESWFDSPYYSLLYAYRDEAEAENFVRALADKFPPRARILDAPCGNGRHARALAKLGFRVTGCDLSSRLLSLARPYESPPELVFLRHDLRQPLPGRYDAIVNLFTGFGYFERPEDDRIVFDHFVSALEPGGVLVMDFFHADHVIKNLVEGETVFRDGVRFELERRIVGDRIVKNIRITDDNRVFTAQEKVRLYKPEDFRRMASSLVVEYEWGDYDLSSFGADSPRYIFFARKPRLRPDA
ncbi:MAG: class I SAM-dependent methyltransferase [Bacteroidia bacterium]|nr:class I SAM-dependent methyltransferase [Bacteroidia bacterium]MDW8334121.1 class I SAM-dependent methyltransferase [Bacteroidia bacterium]